MATINVTYEPTAMPNATQQADIEYAATQWEATLANVLTINVQVWAVNMAATHLNAMCIPGIVQTANQTLTRPQAKLSGDIANPHDPAIDLVVVMDTGTAWVLGTPPALPIPVGQCSLATTIMHELCHGLGFLGLCDVNINRLPPLLPVVVPTPPGMGTYSAANTLISMLTTIRGAMIPAVNLPYANFIPAGLLSGFAVVTPFAELFQYTAPPMALPKENPGNAWVAFLSALGNISIQIDDQPLPPILYSVYTSNPFQPFTTCDHISDPGCLMNPSTAGQYFAAPDVPSKNILRAIGWDIP